jgi:phenylalanine-4-hydroxylase
MRTEYIIDDFQQTYFVIDSFETLLAACYQDFGPLYERLARVTDIEPFELTEGDEVLTRGTLAYFKKDEPLPALRAV